MDAPTLSSPGRGPTLTRDGVALGIRMTLPGLPGAILFGATVGTVAAQKGLTLAETVLMSAAVFAGISQIVALQLWTERWTLAALAAVALVVAVVNMRMVLMSAGLRPWLAGAPRPLVYLSLFTLTDVNYLITARARADGRDGFGVLVGSGFFLWAVWVASAVPGYAIGALVADPERFGLDMVMPAYLAALVIPLWRGRRQTLIWGIAGAVALSVAALVPGYWFIIAGALAGAVAGALIDE